MSNENTSDTNQAKALNKTDVSSCVLAMVQYRLKIANLSTKRGKINSVYEIEYNNNNDRGIENVLFGVNQIPILKPLSDLVDNILEDDNDENYQLSCELEELLNTNDCSHFVKALIDKKYYAVDVRLWNDIENWFNKNHFDWKYGLIERGLAININNVVFT